MLFDFHVPHYFSKNVRHEIGELSASTALADLAVSMVMLFEPIFLYSVLHLTVPEILLFTGGIYVVYIPCITLGARFASRFGYKHSIAMSVPLQILFWVFLYWSQTDHWFIWIAPVLLGLEKSFFWPGFHSIVSRYAAREQKGREFSVIYAIVNVTHVFGPLLGGFLSERVGLGAAFFTASVIYSSSVIPLLLQDEVFIPKLYEFKDTLALYRAFPKKALGYIGFGEEFLGLTVWPVFVYIVVHDYQATGALATGASLAAAGISLLIGKITDSYTKRILVKIGALFTSLTWFVRFVASNFSSTFAVDSLGRTSKDVVFIPLSTLTYLRAEATHILPYVVFFEQSLSIGKLSACLLGSLLFVLFGGGHASFVALFVLAGFYSLLYAYI